MAEALVDGDAGGDLKSEEVGAEDGDGGGLALDEVDVGGTATVGLDPDGTAAGIEISEARAGNGGAEDVEEGSRGGRSEVGAGGGALGGEEEPGAEGAGDDAHREMVADESDAGTGAYN